MMEPVRAWQRVLDGDLDGAEADPVWIRARFDPIRDPRLWASQAVEVGSFIARRRGASVPGAPAIPTAEPGPDPAPLARGPVAAARGEGCVPDFLVLGAQEAGTSWLHRNIADHPEIWVPPIKALHYFGQRFAKKRS
jgi:hypothetical protein